MPIEQLLSLTGLVIVMVGTPGPNNLMLMASGVNFGVRRSIPHLAGIIAGCELLLQAMALGLGQLLVIYPGARILLKLLSAIFLLYVAWLLVTGKGSDEHPDRPSSPMSFWQAVLFQWVNPKAWMICMAIAATYTDPSHLLRTATWTGLIFALVSLPLILTWNVSGQILRHWLRQGTRILWFNRIMAALLIVCLYPLLR